LLFFHSCSITGNGNPDSDNEPIGEIDLIRIPLDQNDTAYIYKVYRSIDGVRMLVETLLVRILEGSKI
jgi:hypothetical protein